MNNRDTLFYLIIDAILILTIAAMIAGGAIANNYYQEKITSLESEAAQYKDIAEKATLDKTQIEILSDDEIDDLNTIIIDLRNELHDLEEILDSHRLNSNEEAMKLQYEIDTYRLLIEDYEVKMEEIKSRDAAEQKVYTAIWNKRMKEYPEATTVWKYLTEELGYNNYVAAGILGNMMLECGGNSLKLQPTIYSSNRNYYGLCQWNVVTKRNNGVLYNGKVKDANLMTQLNYLAGEEFGSIKYAFDHSSLVSYDSFTSLTNCEKAAEMFAKVYEVCGNTYYTRGINALRAYQYFVD